MITVYLKTPLFSFRRASSPHVPAGTAAIRGEQISHEGGGFTVRAERYLDGAGNALDGSVCTLFLPNGKIDHVLIEDVS